MNKIMAITAVAACFFLGMWAHSAFADEPTRSDRAGLWLRDAVGTVGSSLGDATGSLFFGADERDCLDIPNDEKSDECLDEWLLVLSEALTEAKLERAGRK